MIVKRYSLKKSWFGAEMVQSDDGPWANHDEVLRDLGSEVAAANKHKTDRAMYEALVTQCAQQGLALTGLEAQRTSLEDQLEAKHDKWDEMRQQKEALDEIATNTQTLLEKAKEETLKTTLLLAESAAREVNLQKQLALGVEAVQERDKIITAQAERINDLEVDRTDEMAEADGAKHEKTEAEAENVLLKEEVQTQATQLAEMKEIMEVALKQLKEADAHKTEMESLVDKVHQGAAENIAALPNLRPFEKMQLIADPGKSVLQTWAEAMWPQLSPELQSEILLWHAQSLTDPELVRKQMELVMSIQAGTSSPSVTPQESVSPTEAPEATETPQE